MGAGRRWPLDGPAFDATHQTWVRERGSGVVRTKDQADFDAVLPMLGPARQTRLAETLARAHPGHRWLAALR